jgi:hypothetical protein
VALIGLPGLQVVTGGQDVEASLGGVGAEADTIESASAAARAAAAAAAPGESSSSDTKTTSSSSLLSAMGAAEHYRADGGGA